MEQKAMIIYAGQNLSDIQKVGLPAFIRGGVYKFGDKVPRQFGSGDVPVYTQARNDKFVYLGILIGGRLDRASGTLLFERFLEFPAPVVAYDGEAGVNRDGLYSPNAGFGPLDFNYVDAWVPRLIARRAERQGSTQTTFWHLADIHGYGPCSPRCAFPPGPEADDACHNCIKEEIIERMAAQLAAAPPDLLLIAGDIIEGLAGGHEGGKTIIDPLLRAAREHGVVIVGVTGQHDAATQLFRDELGWTWLLDTGECNQDTDVFVRAIGGRGKQKGVLADLSSVDPAPEGRPGILLAHFDPAILPKSEWSAPRFSYYALADRHQLWIQDLAAGAKAACPGHLFSYYDGCGKTWPVFFLRGQVDRTGKGEVEPVALQSPIYLAPHTRQLYVPFESRNQPGGKLVLVNPPERAILDSLRRPYDLEELRYYRERKFPGAAAMALCRAVFSYGSHSELRSLVDAILSATPDDIYVSPSVGAYKKRVKTVASVLLADRFDEYLDKIVQMKSDGLTADSGATGQRRVMG